MAEGDRAAVRIDPLIIGGKPEMITEGEHLDGERLVDLEGTDVIDRQLGLRQRLLRRRNRPDAHHLWIHAGKRKRDEPHGNRKTQLSGDSSRPPTSTRWLHHSVRQHCPR